MNNSINGTNGIKQFFEQHGADVITGVVIIISLLVLVSILGINMNPKHNTHIEKIVTVENFGTTTDDMDINDIDTNDIPIPKSSTAICDHGYLLHEREEKCRQLTKKNCLLTSCCGWLLEKGSSDGLCVAGDDRGLGYHTNDADQKIIIDKWTHRSQKN
jgi:hypothetical protein